MTFQSTIIFLLMITFFGAENLKLVYGSGGTGKSGSTGNIIERFENMRKPPNDSRSYRGLRLKNRMKVMLISDPTTEKSAAALVVGVGSLNDPPETPGLVNLIGYVLAKASKKYPASYAFRHYVHSHGGIGDMPVTREEDQIFSFEIDPPYLANALDRLAQFFLQPLLAFAPHLILTDALEYVQLEHMSRVTQDEYRILEIEKLMSKPNHPYRHHVLGNVDTFNQQLDSLYNKVKSLHSFWYSSNIMSLAVLGKESLNELEKMVTSLFKNVEDKNVKKIRYSHKFHPWGEDQLKFKVYIKPYSDLERILRLNFPVPDVRDFGKLPDAYIEYFMACGGPGCVFSVLRSMKLCTDFHVLYESPAGIALLSIICDLTEEGLNRVDEIVYLIFQYIYVLKEDGVQEWMFHMLKKQNETFFSRWKPDKVEYYSKSVVENIATSMENYFLGNIVWYNFHRGIEEWDPCVLIDILKYLRPDNMNITIVSQSFSEVLDPTTAKEGYVCESIDPRLLKKWSIKKSVPELYLPSPNEFIPENFTVYPVNDLKEAKHPYIIHQSSISEIWFKQDDEFRVPELQVQIEFISSVTLFGPSEHTMWCLFHTLLEHSLNVYQADYIKLAEVKWATWNTFLNDYKIRIRLHGNNDKLPKLLENLILRFVNLGSDVNKKVFKKILNEHIQILKDSSAKPLYQLEWYSKFLQNQGGWTIDNVLNVGKGLQYVDMQKFLTKVFRRIFIRGLIHGNCTKQMAQEYIDILENSFQSSKGLLLQELLVLRPRRVEIADVSHFACEIATKNPGVSGYSLYFQLDNDSSNLENMSGYVLHEILPNLCRSLISGKDRSQFLEIQCLRWNPPEIRGFIILMRIKNTLRVVELIEKFLRKIYEILKELPNLDFESYKKEVEKYITRPTSLSELFEKYWYEIENRYYYFDRTTFERKELHALEKTSLLTFAKETFGVESFSRRRMLTIHVFPKGSKQAPKIPAGAIEITELDAFKTGSTLLPFTPVPPFMDRIDKARD